MKKLLIVLSILLIVFIGKCYSQAGTLDVSYNEDGKALFDLENSHEVANALITLPDNTTILAGSAILNASFDGFLVRILENGDRDLTFGDNGYAQIQLGMETYAKDLVLLPDGKLLVSGLTYTSGSNASIFVARYFSDGTIDQSFGTDGLYYSTYSSEVEECNVMFVQPDGKILLAGSTSLGAFSQMLFTRITADGNLDTGFGSDGYTIINDSPQDEQINDIGILSDGSIIGVGAGYKSAPWYGELAFLAKLDSDGNPVSSFGNNGVLFPDILEDISVAYAVEIINDSILVTGRINNGGGGQDLFLTKFDEAGNVDMNFGSNGISFGSNNYSNIGLDILRQPDNKIYVCGSSGLGGINNSEFYLLRYLPDGSLDVTFNGIGYVTTDFRADWDDAFTMGMTADWKLILAGVSGGLTTSGDNKIATARYLNDFEPFFASFYATPNPVCEGGVVDFINNSGGDIIDFSWTFEGGTPSASNDQNPQITYNTVGNYDVQLIITDVNLDKDTLLLQDYIQVISLPAQADIPDGLNEVCAGETVYYSTLELLYAEDYEWLITPASAGNLTWIMNEATLEVTETWSGDFTIKVRATNNCGDGEWSNELLCTVNLLPEPFDLVGGGEICEGDPGLEISLMDSEVDVDYELFNNNISTGIIVSGTGEAISFGLFTAEGNYSAIGFTDYCSSQMYGEVPVIVSVLPEQLSIPLGEEEVCNNLESEYSTSGGESTDEIVWALTPENAGILAENGINVLISWNNNFSGTASLTVQAVNSCGDGPVSEVLQITVIASSAPEVTGDDLVCKEEESVYSTIENSGNTYDWDIVGGTITSGEGTHEITVLWGNTPGQAYIMVEESSAETSCSAIDSLAVTIDDCTGMENNIADQVVRLYPNPTQSNINLEFIARKGEKISISIYNSLGQLVVEKQEVAIGEKQVVNFNLEDQPNGIYVVTIKTPEQVIWKGKLNKY